MSNVGTLATVSVVIVNREEREIRFLRSLFADALAMSGGVASLVVADPRTQRNHRAARQAARSMKVERSE